MAMMIISHRAVSLALALTHCLSCYSTTFHLTLSGWTLNIPTESATLHGTATSLFVLKK